MFNFLLERIKSRIFEAIILPEPQQKMVDKYGSKSESSHWKYFILSNGQTVDAVSEHTRVAMEADVNFDDLLESGAIRASGKNRNFDIEIDVTAEITDPQFKFIENKINEIYHGALFRIDFSETIEESRGMRMQFSSSVKVSYEIPISEYRDEFISLSDIREIIFGHGNVSSKYQLNLVG